MADRGGNRERRLWLKHKWVMVCWARKWLLSLSTVSAVNVQKLRSTVTRPDFRYGTHPAMPSTWPPSGPDYSAILLSSLCLASYPRPSRHLPACNPSPQPTRAVLSSSAFSPLNTVSQNWLLECCEGLLKRTEQCQAVVSLTFFQATPCKA